MWTKRELQALLREEKAKEKKKLPSLRLEVQPRDEGARTRFLPSFRQDDLDEVVIQPS